ncbi:unnamed protein product, partial [Hapterophycus canaliculatus]
LVSSWLRLVVRVRKDGIVQNRWSSGRVLAHGVCLRRVREASRGLRAPASPLASSLRRKALWPTDVKREQVSQIRRSLWRGRAAPQHMAHGRVTRRILRIALVPSAL